MHNQICNFHKWIVVFNYFGLREYAWPTCSRFFPIVLEKWLYISGSRSIITFRQNLLSLRRSWTTPRRAVLIHGWKSTRSTRSSTRNREKFSKKLLCRFIKKLSRRSGSLVSLRTRTHTHICIHAFDQVVKKFPRACKHVWSYVQAHETPPVAQAFILQRENLPTAPQYIRAVLRHTRPKSSFHPRIMNIVCILP